MDQDGATKRRGRPRVTPEGLAPADRANAWTRDWKRAGGHRLPVNLSPSAWRELQKMAGPRERGPFIDRLILAEAARRRAEREPPTA